MTKASEAARQPRSTWTRSSARRGRVPRAPLEIRRTPAAEQDLIDIWLYTAREWGADQADLYLDALDAALSRLRAFAPDRQR